MKLTQKRTIYSIFILTVFLSACDHSSIQNQKEQKEIPAPTISVEDFFKIGVKSGFRISPDGKYYSYKSSYKDKSNIFVQRIADGSVRRVTTDTLRSINQYLWKGNKIVYLQDFRGDENYQLFSVGTDGGLPKGLTPFPGVTTIIIDDLTEMPGRENEMIIGINKRSNVCIDPYLLNIETGELQLLYENNENYDTWVTDNDGVLRMAAKPDGLDIVWSYRKNKSNSFQPIDTISFENQFDVTTFDKANNNVYVLSNVGRDKVALVEYNPITKKEIKLLFSDPNYDLESVQFDRKKKKLTSVSWTAEKPERHFFDQQWEQINKNIEEKFKNYSTLIVSYNSNRTKAIVGTYNDRNRGIFHLYDFKTQEIRQIANPYPWLKEKQMSHVKPITYTSRDGLTIHGYLTLPLGREAKNLPVIINPHGGPWSRDEWGCNPETQLLANRGYAVLQLNFRGSTGYGKKFYKAGFKEWGGKMQHDITDGVNWLKKKGIADPKRIAIYGGSFGGNAALFGVTLTPDLYAAGVADVAASNMFTFLSSLSEEWGPYMGQFYESIGDPKNPKDSAMLVKISPLFHVDQIKAPLFISCGKNDPRVSRSESDQLVRELRKRHRIVEYMVKDDEGHGFNNQNNQFDFYNAMLRFLDRYVKNKTSS